MGLNRPYKVDQNSPVSRLSGSMKIKMICLEKRGDPSEIVSTMRHRLKKKVLADSKTVSKN